MNRKWVVVITTIILALSLIASVSAWGFASQTSIRSQTQWNPWGMSSQTSIQSSTQSFGMPGPMMAPIRYGGIWGGNCWDPYLCGYMFAANESQIADVSGTWETDILGKMSLKLTGDDTIRGTYEINGTKGYVEGNFTPNGTPTMDGLWWEAPTYQPPMSAGVMTIEFVNESYLKGIYSYPDGIWGPFTATKTEANLTSQVEEELKNMPEVSWDVNKEEVKDYRVSNKPEDNPVMTPEA
ncbi:MAG TPA: hypothetical protein VN372_13690 [Methanospirillum sp.]|nr:hypothetical protein [Methanospirillum sp.]